MKLNQKKIDHIFHYTDEYEYLKKILRNGFAPSYCVEEINDTKFLTPMVSFCNIPIRDVGDYMHYGDYGIGMSVDWAIENNLSPVIYIHENTPFKNVRDVIYNLSFNQFINRAIHNTIKEKTNSHVNDYEYALSEEQILELNNSSFLLAQFLKNWKTIYKGDEIITYHEREWRYIPNLDAEKEKKLVAINDEDFNIYLEKKKPHLPERSLHIESIKDIRYIIIKDDVERKEIIDILIKEFTQEEVWDSISSGKLMILNTEQIANDF